MALLILDLRLSYYTGDWIKLDQPVVLILLGFRIQPGASESEVKKAFRQLALQYHPDVCRGSNCGVKFQRMNEAYDAEGGNRGGRGRGNEGRLGVVGWEGAGIPDYSSHINPYL
ncbi:hypothetical protein GQ457_03G042560 [Hibiscus cannabinus]